MKQDSDKTLTPGRYTAQSGEKGLAKGDEIDTLTEDKDASKNLDPEAVYTMKEAMDAAGYGAFNKFAIVACCLVHVQAVLQLSAFVFVIDLAQCDLLITADNRLLLEISVYCGIAMTSVYWGIMSDRYGRRKIVRLCTLLSILTSFINTLDTNFWSFLMLRCLTGCVISGVFTTVLVYLSEFSLGKHRNKSIALVLAATSVALVIAPIVAVFVIPTSVDYKMKFRDTVLSKVNSWRTYMWTWNVSGALGYACFLCLPKSPAYILASDGPFRALRIVKKIHERNNYYLKGSFPVTKMKTSTRVLRGPHEFTWRETILETRQLFQFPLKRCMIISHFCMMMVYITLNCLYLRLPNIYQTIIEDSECSCSVCEILVHNITQKSAFIEGQFIKDLYKAKCTEKDVKIDMLLWLMGAHLFFVLIYSFVATVINNTSKKTILYAFTIIPCSISLFAGTVMPQAVAAGMLATIPLTAGIGVGILTILVVEVCPTCLRATAIGSMNSLAAVGAALTIICLSWSVTKVSCVFVLLTIAFLTFLSVYIMAFQWPEVEEIRKVMERRDFTY